MKIGKIIKNRRLAAGITQAELAKRSGLDFTTISKLEKGSLTGTIVTHRKLAKAFGISLIDLYKELDEPSNQTIEAAVKTNGKTDTFYYNDRATSQILLSRISRHKMVPELTRIEPRGSTHIEQRPKGTEQFIFVLDGEIEIKSGEITHQLRKGESVYFDASLPHIIKNVSPTTAKCLRVSTPAGL